MAINIVPNPEVTGDQTIGTVDERWSAVYAHLMNTRLLTLPRLADTPAELAALGADAINTLHLRPGGLYVGQARVAMGSETDTLNQKVGAFFGSLGALDTGVNSFYSYIDTGYDSLVQIIGRIKVLEGLPSDIAALDTRVTDLELNGGGGGAATLGQLLDVSSAVTDASEGSLLIKGSDGIWAATLQHGFADQTDLDDITTRVVTLEGASYSPTAGTLISVTGGTISFTGDLSVYALESDLTTSKNTLQSAIDAEATARSSAVTTLQSNIDAANTAITSEETRATAAESALSTRIDNLVVNGVTDLAGLSDTDTVGATTGDLLQLNASSDWTISDVRVDTWGSGYDVSTQVTFNYQSASDVISKSSTNIFSDDYQTTNTFYLPDADGTTDYLIIDMTGLDKSTVQLSVAPLSSDAIADGEDTGTTTNVLGLVGELYYFWSTDGATWLYNTTGFPDLGANTSLVPRTDLGVSLGSPDKRFNDLYLSGNTIYLGGLAISNDGGNLSTGTGARYITSPELGAEITTINSSISAEATARTSADNTLQANIDTVSNSLAAEVTRASTAEAANATAISTETGRATTAETALQTNIDAEETRALAAEAANASAISAEVTRATAAESALGVRIDNVLTNADPSALDSLTELVAAFQAADSNLSTAITNALGTHTSELAAHVTANAASFSAINGSIVSLSSDIAAATASISSLTSTVDSNRITLESADTQLSSDISALDTSLQGLISTEATTRASADTALDTRVTANENDISTTQTALSALQTTVSTLQSGSASDVSALQTDIDNTSTGAFGNTLNTYPSTSGTNYVDSASNLYDGIILLDTALDAAVTDLQSGIDGKQDILSAVSPLTLTSGSTLSVDLSSYATAASLSSVESRVSTLEGAQTTLNINSSGSSALTYDSATSTIALTDADVNAGTAASLASAVELLLSGAVTGSATFSSGGTVSLNTSFSVDMATQAELDAAVSSATSLTNAVSSRVSTIEGDYLTSASTLSSARLSARNVTIAGLSVDLGGAITAASLSSAIDLGSYVTSASLTALNLASQTDLTNAVSGLASSADVTAEIATAISDLVDSAPATLDTLNELAAALGDDPNYATTISAQLGTLSARITSVDNAKQDALTAGGGITLSGATISTSFDIADYVTASSYSTDVTSINSSISDLQDADTAFGVQIASITLSIGTLTTDLSTEAATARAAESANASAITALSLSLNTSISNEASTRASADSALATSISAVSLSLHTDLNALSSTVAGHTTTLASHASTLTSLATLISSEESARISADSALGGRIDGVIADLAAATLSLSASIVSLQDADTAFASSISALESSISSVSLSLAGEVTRATSAEGVLASSITSLVSDLSAETTARTSADSTLQANIDAEASTRATAISTLTADIAAATASISTETAARISADTTLQTNIDAEAVARASADTTLSTRIDNLDTDAVTEGTSLYYTDARARGAISVTDSGGDGSLTYDSSTGVITYQGPSSADVTQHLNAGTNITLSGGTFSLSSLLTNIIVSGHVLEAFDHGSVSEAHGSAGDYGNVSSNSVTHAVDLGGLDNGSLF